MNKKKKIWLALVGVLIVLVVVALILSRKRAEVPEIVEEVKPLSVVEESVTSLSLAPDKKEMYSYSQDQETLSKVRETEIGYKLEEITKLEGAQDYKLSPDGNQVAFSVLSQDQTKSVYKLHKFDTEEWSNLNENIRSIIWHPNGKEIFYSYYDGKNSNINILNVESMKWEKLVDLRIDETGIMLDCAQDGKKIAYSAVGGGEEPASILHVFNIDSKEEILKLFNTENAKFTLDGNKLIAEIYKGLPMPVLWLVNLEDSTKKNLGLNSTIDKLALTNNPNEIVCAQIERLEEFRTVDTFWKINIETGGRIQLTRVDPDNLIDAKDLIVSPDGSLLYYVNQYDSKLYSLTLALVSGIKTLVFYSRS